MSDLETSSEDIISSGFGEGDGGSLAESDSFDLGASGDSQELPKESKEETDNVLIEFKTQVLSAAILGGLNLGFRSVGLLLFFIVIILLFFLSRRHNRNK